MIPKDGPVDVVAVYTELGEPPTADGYDVAYICSNSYGTDKYKKINPRAKYKPYKLPHLKAGSLTEELADKFTDLTDEDRKTINYGMTPKGFDVKNHIPVALLWGQWEPPVPGVNWCRINDFAGYCSDDTISGMSGIKLFCDPSSPAHPMQPLHPRLGESWLRANMTLTAPQEHELSVWDFKNTYNAISFNDMCFTLLFGVSDGSEFFDSGIVWAVQSPPLSQYEDGNAWNIKMRMKITDGENGMAKHFTGNGDDCLLYCVCLCPPLVFDGSNYTSRTLTDIESDNPKRVTAITRPNGSNLSLSQFVEVAVSLNMWEDGAPTIYLWQDFGTNIGGGSTTNYKGVKKVTGHAEPETPDISYNGCTNGTMHFRYNGDLIKIILGSEWQSRTDYNLSNGYVKLAIRLSRSGYIYETSSIEPISSEGIIVESNSSDGKYIAFFATEPPTTFSVSLSDFGKTIPDGEYKLDVALVFIADGTYKGSDGLYKTVLDTDGSSDYIKDGWGDSQNPQLPVDGVYTKSLTFNNVQISN